MALTIFNDVLIRAAIERSLAVIDLRMICSTSADYANPIEPSPAGGEKIAKAIVALTTGGHDRTNGMRILGAPLTTPTSG